MERIPVATAAASTAFLRQNNFDLLRFLFAFIVLLVHAHVLSGADELSILSEALSSEIAVKSFFVVSGFLIFMSYENSRSLRSYFEKRVRRIYPAYLSIVVICAVMGSVFSAVDWGGYFSFQTLKYLLANLLFLNFLQPSLPGLFENNQLQAVNGALWTLKIEVMFYLIVPLVVMAFRKYGRMRVMVELYIGSLLFAVIMGQMAVQTGSGLYLELQRQLPGQLVFFIAGAAGYYYFRHLARYSTWLVLAALAAFAMQSWLPWVAIQPVALAVLVVYFACVIPCLGNFGKYGDFSYGVYIIHFPILQLLASYGLFGQSPWLMLVAASLLVMIAAFCFWHFIEKPFLSKSSHYVAVEHE